MGRQIHFHTYGHDTDALVEFIDSRCALTVTLGYSDEPTIEAVDDPASETRGMTLWNRDLLPELARTRIKLNDGGKRFYVEYSHPVLEFSPSKLVNWNLRPALLQGRIYGSDFFDRDAYSGWYSQIQRWIAKNFRRNPFGSGYVGPDAWHWFKYGSGILLPQINPPVFPAWLTEFAKQDIFREQEETPCDSRSRAIKKTR